MDEPLSSSPADGHAIAKGPLRWLLLGAGFLFLGLGVVGVILPLLPTTPFVLVAAACFSRSSPRFYNWLLSNRVFGPTIHEWRAHRSIPLHAKVMAVTLITLVGGSSILFVLDPLWAKLVVGGVLLAVMAWLLTHPTTPPERTNSYRQSLRPDDPGA